ncbi:hypothetical protein SAMN06265346_104239 [Flavobacterium hercynium]|uniref:Macroglobulin domain-containing protein n=2 Tax=Flavobacterium hercynium TaxID=387094 RepID=A0A226GVM3_9FLAO|nr:hypothetical protein B0A66_18380 [Flavobacterium hercynium]SMP15643.1 hypothetical protein SAMN06265346_104239 [Flavobacterium hercynium]
MWQFPAYSQNGSTVSESKMIPEVLAKQFHDLSKNNTSDLVYLQTSKNIYETEEDVWFKGYVLDAQFFLPSGNSKILFVQLIEDKTDKVVWEKKYEIESGFVNGHLFLDSNLAEGTYTLAAYSSFSYTRNSKEFYALKKLEVLKSISRKEIFKPVKKDITLHFNVFPEGGKLVHGIENTLAFKAVDSNGLPIDVSGSLYENNKPLLDLKSIHAGMGSFVFTPDADKKYHILLTSPASGGKFSLGEIYRSGKTLQLAGQTKETLIFKVSQSAALKEETVYLRTQVRGIVYSIAVGLLKKELIIKVPLKDIPQGIAEVTLFSENSVPEAERLVYVNPDQKLNINAQLDKNSYETREKATLKIKVTDQNGQPAAAHLGLSVYDKLYQNKGDAKNIFTHYLLSTQLKGNIYDPAYYFNTQNKNRHQALNLLLLTQGWRSYVWEESNLREKVKTVIPIVSDELKAKISLRKNNAKTTEAPPQGIKVFSADEHKGSDIVLADEAGVFFITPDHLRKGQGGYTYLKLMTPQESKYHIDIKDFSFEEINRERKIKTVLYPIPALLNKKTEDLQLIGDRPDINKLNEVLITSKKKIIFRDKFIGKLDSLAKIKPSTDYVCENGILNCPKHPPYPNYKFINTTNNRQFSEAELLVMFNIAAIKGFYGKKVFYEPIYDLITINDPTADYRNTLYWKPDLITNEQGEATVSFFCSDINTSYLGNIEGVSGDGLLGTENFEFLVKKK